MALDIFSFNSAQYLHGQVQTLVKNCFSDPNWLRAFEGFSGVAMEPCHHLLANNGTPIGFLPSYIQSESLCGTLRSRLFGRLSQVPVYKTWGTQNALVCSSPWGFYSGIDCLPKDGSTVYKAFIEHINHIAINKKLDLSGFPFVPEASPELRRQLQAGGYKEIPIGPTTTIELKWNSFDEYVSGLPSRSIRSVIRRERKKAKRLTFEWFEGNSLREMYFGRPLYSIIMELYNNTYYKYAGNRSILNNSFLPKLWEMDKKNLRLCIAILDRKIVAFVLLRVFRSTAHAFMVGRDYSLADDFHSYFNVIYYEPIIRGIKEKWNSIYFRPGVYQAKLRRGCQLENLYMYVKGHNLWAKLILELYTPIARKYYQDKFSPTKLFDH